MPAARYWRLIALEAHAGADLELSELHLYSGAGRLDAAATLTSTIAPSEGALIALQDDDLASTCRFAAAAVRAGGFAIVWDFGAGNTADVLGLRLGAATSRGDFLAGCTLQYSTDGKLWLWQADFSRYDFPGAGAYTNAPVAAEYRSLVLGAAPMLYWRLDETSGTVAADASGNGNSGTYTSDAASFSTVGLVDGNRAISLAGTNGQIGITKGASPLNHTQPWTAVILAQPAAPPVFGVGTLWVLGGSSSPEIDVLDAGGGRFRIRVMASGTAQLFVSSSSWVYGTKVLAVVRYSGSVISLNVNGIAEGQASSSHRNPGGVLRIGFSVFGGSTTYYPLNGVLDEFSLHQSLLSDAQVQALNAAFAGGGGGGGAAGPVFLPPLLRAPAPDCARIAASSPVPPHSTLSVPPLLLARDMEFGGSGTVYGTVDRKGTPANVPLRRRVRLHSDTSGLLVRETWSDAETGEFSFAGIDPTQKYTTISYDHEHNFRAVIADNLTPEVPQ